MMRNPWVVAVGLSSIVIAGCSPSSLVDVPVTNGVADPGAVTTPTGAMRLYEAAVGRWAQSVAGGPGGTSLNFVTQTGLFTDELMKVQGGFGDTFNGIVWDERNNGSITLFASSQVIQAGGILPLQSIRTDAGVAREALTLYAPNAPVALRARMQAQEAFGIVYLAEWSCSGTALSKVSIVNGPQFTRSYTTEEMLTQAIALFDSAIAIAGDSVRFRYLAEVGKGRALLDAGRFADAAAAVRDVPTDFVYFLEVTGSTSFPGANQIGSRPQNLQVRDNEGSNGLSWSIDPRTAVVTTPTISGAMLVPGKYSVTNGVINAAGPNPSNPVRAADGLEARLIEAEGSLAQNDPSWLAKLNALRSTCIGSAACAPIPALTASNLPPNLTDPGNSAARLDLLMKERAMWLYLTGHRQGDLRRMAHIYNRDPMTLWPIGPYVNPGFPPFVPPASDNGLVSYVNVFVIPGGLVGNGSGGETPANPLYTGCVDLNP